MKKNKWLKRLIVPAVGVVLVAAIVLGVMAFARGSAKPVEVVPFPQVGMTEYWGDNQETSGLIAADKIQTVYLSETQTVTRILVSEGDSVKKGDLLLTFDSTLDALALEKERLGVEKLKLELEDARTEMIRIQGLKPMVVPEDKPETDVNLGLPLAGRYQIISDADWNGADPGRALICWLGSTTTIDSTLLEDLLLKVRQLRQLEEQLPPEEGEEPAPEPGEPDDTPVPEINNYYVIFKITDENMSLGETLMWQGLWVSRDPQTGAYSFRFFDASVIYDPTMVQPEEPDFDFGSGYTAQEIYQMALDQQKTIKDLQLRVKMAEADYKIKKAEVGDGNIYAQVDGTVISVLDPQMALDTLQPVLKVTGGGGFTVTGPISELARDSLTVGQEVTVMDWYGGGSYTGTIQSIRDYPSSEQNYYGGNPNVSYYDLTVFVDGSASLNAGTYASIQFSMAQFSDGLYLSNPYLRTEGGKSWVYVRGKGDKLEKRYVTTGRSLWGSFTQILSGLEETDYIAFPYGKDVAEGAPTKEASGNGMIMY